MSNVNIDIDRDLGLTNLKKYWRLAGKIEMEVDGLHKGWILVLAAFVKDSRKMNDNQEVTENMKIRRDIDPG